jgi:hypothetical protein
MTNITETFDENVSFSKNIHVTGNVGIGTTAPALALEVEGDVGGPATSGTSQTGILRLAQSGTVVGDMGIRSTSPYGLWIQSTSSAILC